MGLSPPAPQMTEWVVEEANTPHSLLQWKTNKDANKKKSIERKCEKVALVIPQMTCEGFGFRGKTKRTR